MLVFMWVAAMMSGCGGGTSGSEGETTSVTSPTSSVGAAKLAAAIGTSVGAPIVAVTMESTSNYDQRNVPFTFGQVFKPGDVPASAGLVGQFDRKFPRLQTDIKSVYADGSVKHAVISGILPQLSAGRSAALILRPALDDPGSCASPDALLAAGFTADVNITIAGKLYRASAQDALRSASGKTWLCGGIATEWIVSLPFVSTDSADHGTQDPHLTARFAIRHYPNAQSAKVDMIVENDWAYDPAPQNITYDVSMDVGSRTVYSKTGLTHYNHARWKKTFWWGVSPEVATCPDLTCAPSPSGKDPSPKLNIRHDPAYLMATGAVPNYDTNVTISALALSNISTAYSGSKTEPMNSGLAEPYMPTTGGRPDIGLLPGWTVSYLLSQVRMAKNAVLGTADLAGTYSIHYRDKNTDKPISIVDYPYMTLRGRYDDTYNPVTKQYEAFPPCAGSCATPFVADPAHEPSLSFLPYLVTGDYYHLEELEFWTAYNMFISNPGYRQYSQGLIFADQVRGQAWVLRSLAEAAYIIPDADPLKNQFATFLANNIDWYTKTYVGNSTSGNSLGIVTSEAFSYMDGTAIAPWQDDFFTSAVGRAVELGFVSAKPLLQWKARFPVSRMVDRGYCWILASDYNLKVRDSITSPLYTTMQQAYLATEPAGLTSLACGSADMASYLQLQPGEMVGYSDSVTGFPANMQPAIAYSVNSGIADGVTAWAQFQQRANKPNYGDSAQFAIVPR